VQFDTVDWNLRRHVGIWLLSGLPICLGFGAIFYVSLGLVVAALVALLVALIIIWAYWRVHFVGEPRDRYLARHQPDQPPRVTFSGKGLWEAGMYFPLHESGKAELEQVTMTSRPPTLHFRRALFASKYAPNPARITYATLHVLVPRGHEEEAVRLMQRYHREVIEPEKQWRERWKAPSLEPHSSGSPEPER
jgi:hypothetical protein